MRFRLSPDRSHPDRLITGGVLLGRSCETVNHSVNGYTEEVPRYAVAFVDLLKDVARLQREAEIDLPDDERVRRKYRDLLRKLRAIKTDFERTAQGYYIKIDELEEELEERVDPHHREEHFGERTENRRGARQVSR